MDVFEGITALADYGVRTGLIEEADRTWLSMHCWRRWSWTHTRNAPSPANRH